MFVYFRPKILTVFLLGISSGFPFSLTASTFLLFLTDVGIDLVSIGIMSIVVLPYTLKYLWAPIIDSVRIPILGKLIGHRKSWLLLSQLTLSAIIFLMSFVSANSSISYIAVLGVSLAFLSATQDIIIDAFRIEMLDEEEQGAGAAFAQFGYRFGMLITSVGALYIAQQWSWKIAYCTMAVFQLQGIWLLLLAKEPKINRTFTHDNILSWVKDAFIAPFADFMSRKNWILMFALVLSYKMSDAYIGPMTGPFLLQIGFSKIEISNITKIYGTVATLLGTAFGGYLISQISIHKMLFLGAALQAISNLVFVWQAVVGHNISVLTVCIGIDNLAGGISSAALVAYISLLANKQFTAAQYALLSSFASLCRTSLTASSGYAALKLGWPAFFAYSSLLCIPSLICLYCLRKNNSSNKQSILLSQNP